jgi:sulfoxide reductase heme-binding subunit YedZ
MNPDLNKQILPERFALPALKPLPCLIHLGACLPLLLLGLDALTGKLTINPIQYITQHLGRDAILLLTAALAITPLVTLTGLRVLQKFSRPLGLYAFIYAALHLLMYVGVDYAFAFDLLWQDVQGKNYIILGFSAFLILSALAITSFRWWMKRLGKNWKKLHRLVYLAGLLVVVHYGLAVKGDLFRLQGDVVKPALYGLVILILLVLRLPFIRQTIKNLKP